MKRPKHRVEVKSEQYFTDCALYYRSACIPAVDNRKADIIFNAINGELDMSNYSYVTNPLGSTKEKFKQFPSKIRNFDILSPVLMLLMGEKRRRGLRYTVIARNSNIETQRAELEKEMSDRMLVQQLMQEFIAIKQAMGEEVDIAQQEQLTVEKIMKASQSLQDAVSIQGQNALDYIRDYNELDRKFIEGWYYWICTGRVFSFRDIQKDEVVTEIVSPKEMSYLAGSSVRFLEDAECTKRRVKLSLSEMTDKFEGVKGYDKIRLELEAKSGIGLQTFGSQLAPQLGDEQDTPQIRAATAMWSKLWGDSDNTTTDDSYEVEHIVWDSLMKIGKVTTKNIYGETFTEEVDSDFTPREGETVEWTWCKIKAHAYVLDGRYVIGGELLPVTLSSVDKPYSAKSPYNGRIFNLRHTNPVGLMQKGLDYQIKYNIIHYYIEKTIAKNMDKIVILPLGLIPEGRGHTTESIMYYAQSHGFMFVDETKKNFQAAMNGVKVLDASLNSQINQLYEYLRMIKQEWKELVGITPGREGQMQNSNDGKALMENSVFRSSVMTEEWFAEYEEFEQRDLQYLMEISKYAYKNGKKTMFIRTDKSKVLLDIDPTTFSYSDYLCRVSNSGKDLEELERAQALAQAMAQNTQGRFSAVLKVLRSKNISELIGEMERMENEFQENQDRIAQQQNQTQSAIQESKERVANRELDYKYYDTDVKSDTQLMTAEIGAEASLMGNKTGDDAGSGDMAALLQNNEAREKRQEEMRQKAEDRKSKERMNKQNNDTRKYVVDKQSQIAKVNKN